MPLRINDKKISNALIIEEIERLRPEYQKNYPDQDVYTREAQLLEWAKENIIERVLIQEYAKQDPRKISQKRVKNAIKRLKKKYTEEKHLYELFGIKNKDEQKLKELIKSQLRTDRAIQNITKDMPVSASENERKIKIDEFIDELKKAASIKFTLDEELKSLPKTRKHLPKKNTHTGEKVYRKQLNFLLVKPAGPDCNMACTYCFYYKKFDSYSNETSCRMNFNVLEKMIRQAIAQSTGHISFGWQGGEPTLMKLPFFQKAVELQKKYGKSKSIDNTFQTNGLLIDREWALFFRNNDFLIGLSLDGPEHIHDHYRLNLGGKGTWKEVVRTAKTLLDHNVKTNALIVVNSYSVQFPREIYNFHKNLGLNFMQFIPCVETDPDNPNQAAPFSVSADQYGTLLCTLFDLWLSDFHNDTPTISIRLFDSVFCTYVNLSAPQCTQSKECGEYVVIEHTGDVYSCDFFVEPKWKLGNVMTDTLITYRYFLF